MPIATLNSLSFAYTPDQPLFQDFNWSIADGERWAVLGPSGCGKSSLLLLLAGILKPTSGQILIEGTPLNRPRPQTGLILQDYGLMPWATVEANAALGLKLHKFYGPDGKHAPAEDTVENLEERVDYWLERLGLDGIRKQYPGQISGGQQQRTAIARSLTLDPNLLLMDEPLGSLDAPTSASLQRLLVELNLKNDLAMVMVTHSVDTAIFLGQKILLLGQPPNREPEMIDNPQAGTEEYRDSQNYQQLSQSLRQKLEGSL